MNHSQPTAYMNWIYGGADIRCRLMGDNIKGQEDVLPILRMKQADYLKLSFVIALFLCALSGYVHLYDNLINQC